VVGFKCLDRQEELRLLWKEFIIVPIYKEGNKTGCSNCTIFYKTILSPKLTPYVDKIIGDRQRGF
jgi:hypothetical protein